MPLSAGTKLGPYEIVSALGAGGMGEVYKARDPRLDRVVAVKVSKADFTERFTREARMVAQLNHPNVCTLHDVGRNYLVMEFVEGGPLKGPLPVERAVEYAGQILDALDAAHRKGIIHRDLKPSNILVTRRGIKLLDFGLAKQDTVLGPDDRTVAAMTMEGQITGTLQYMAPEQLQGRAADARSDIFSFGCVLYEMLSGARAFGGSSAASVIAAILEREPEPLKTTLPVDRVLRKCLAKDPDDRFQTARDLKYNLGLAIEARQATTPAAGNARLPWSVAAVLGLLAVASLALQLRPHPAREVWRFQIPVAGNARLSPYGSFAISPDGRQLAYFASSSDGVSRLWVRSRDSLEARPLPGTEARPSRTSGAPRPPFWSPDSRFVAYGFQGKLMKVDVTGGAPQLVCDIPAAATGGSWNRNNVIIFADNLGGIMTVPAAGGKPSAVTVPDPSRKERNHLLPAFLADGRHFAYYRASGVPDNNGIYVGSLDVTPQQQSVKRLIASDSAAVFAPDTGAGGGSLLFLRAGSLLAERFDQKRLEPVGEPVQVAGPVGSFASFGFFSASADGVLVYRVTNQNSQLTWFDRQGTVLGTVGEPDLYQVAGMQATVSLSPDGARAAVTRGDAEGDDIWVLEFARTVSTRLTTGPGINISPVWSPDGRRIAFASVRARAGRTDLYQRTSDGAGSNELLATSDKPVFPTSWSPDGRFLLYTEGTLPVLNLWLLPLSGDRKPVPWLQTPFFKDHGKFSPNNRWVAYTSGESGQSQVYVQTLDVSAPGAVAAQPGKWVISKGGGAGPHWRADGGELLYSAPDGKIMSVALASGAAFQPGVPQPLFQGPASTSMRSGNDATPSWDVTGDGRRFLFLVPQLDNSLVPFTVLLNWNRKAEK